MLVYLIALITIVLFVALIDFLKLSGKFKQVINHSKQAFEVISNSALDERTKENILQQHSKTLIKLFIVISLGFLLALTVPLMLIAALDWLGLVSFSAVMGALLSWQVILLSTSPMLLFFYLRRTKHEVI